MFKGCIKGLVVCNCLWGIMSGYVEGMKEAFYDVVLAQSTLEVNESLQVDEIRTVLSELSGSIAVFSQEATDTEIESLAYPLSLVFDKHWKDIRSACIHDNELSSYFQNIVKIIPRILGSCGKEDLNTHNILEESDKSLTDRIREGLNDIASNM